MTTEFSVVPFDSKFTSDANVDIIDSGNLVVKNLSISRVASCTIGDLAQMPSYGAFPIIPNHYMLPPHYKFTGCVVTFDTDHPNEDIGIDDSRTFIFKSRIPSVVINFECFAKFLRGGKLVNTAFCEMVNVTDEYVDLGFLGYPIADVFIF